MSFILCENILHKIAQLGVEDICICPGARNANFVYLLDRCSGFKVYSFFEERSAAFFALGKIQASNRPVAVITTSGTAVAETLPAVIEAHYSGLPLIIISADRPRAYRGSGAPQSIEQVGIFSSYVRSHFDLEANQDLPDFKSWNKKGPLHLNICLDEPKLETNPPAIHFSISTDLSAKSDLNENLATENSRASAILNQLDLPLVVVGALPIAERKIVVNFLKNFAAPVYVESLSGLRGETSIQHLLIQFGDQVFNHALESKKAKSLVRIGGVPTFRIWRDLEKKFSDVPVLNLSHLDFSGLSRKCENFALAALAFKDVRSNWISEKLKLITQFDQSICEKFDGLMDKMPKSEVSLLARIAEQIQNRAIYLGNSLPIREWDMVAKKNWNYKNVIGNRGANGIDGQLSTFLGWATKTNESWAIVGDLTALYDLTSLWASTWLAQKKIRILVINNKGGQIFQKMFRSQAFLNQHQLDFSHWAKMWNWDYQLWHDLPIDILQTLGSLPNQVIIELHPSHLQSQEFWQEFSRL